MFRVLVCLCLLVVSQPTKVCAADPAAHADSVLLDLRDRINQESLFMLTAVVIVNRLIVFLKTAPGSAEILCWAERIGDVVRFEVLPYSYMRLWQGFGYHWVICNYRDEYAKFQVRGGWLGCHGNVGGFQWFVRDQEEVILIPALERDLIKARWGISGAMRKALKRE